MMQQDTTKKKTPLVVFGASGHAKVIIDILEKQGVYEISGLIDDDLILKGNSIYGYKVFGGKPDMEALNFKRCLIAIGNNQVRMKIAQWVEENNFILSEAAIHPSSQLARGTSIGQGSVLMANTVVNSDSIIGRNTIINTGATIDHDCNIGESVHIAPGATICGGVSVGDLTLIGAGSVIHPNVKIGENVTVGAGATVLKDVADGLSVVGTPAGVINEL